jgi:hypothetical protein
VVVGGWWFGGELRCGAGTSELDWWRPNAMQVMELMEAM